MAIVYRHIRLDKNEPFYIGIGKTERRAYIKGNRSSLWKKIGLKTEYEVEILFDDLTWEQACEKEIELIKLYGRKDLGLGPLVNMTDGGEGTLNKEPWNKGRKTSEEQILKLKLSHKGMLGKKHSPETIIKIKESSLSLIHI